MHIKRYLVAGAVAATMAGGAFAFAANLDVTSDTLASGSSSTDSGCNAVTVDWTPAYDSGTHAYLIDDIALNGDAACATEEYEVKIDRTGVLADVTLDGTFDVNGDATETGVNLNAADVLHVTVLSTGADVD